MSDVVGIVVAAALAALAVGGLWALVAAARARKPAGPVLQLDPQVSRCPAGRMHVLVAVRGVGDEPTFACTRCRFRVRLPGGPYGVIEAPALPGFDADAVRREIADHIDEELERAEAAMQRAIDEEAKR